jgi:hypothetical protein
VAVAEAAGAVDRAAAAVNALMGTFLISL